MNITETIGATTELSYKCPVTATLGVIGGKWKPVILYILSGGTKRFNEIKRHLPDATQKMLTQQLRELEADEIIVRKVYAEVPPRVEYSLSEKGLTLTPLLKQMSLWGQQHVLKQDICRSASNH